MNRADLVRRLAAHKAAAAALEDALKRDARAEYEEQGTAPTWRLDGARVQVSLSTDRCVVADEETFMDWFAALLPDEVVTSTVRVVRNPAVLKQFLENIAAHGPVPDGETPRDLSPGDTTEAADGAGQVVPGLRWVKGGEYVATSIYVDPTVKRRLAASAARYVEGAPMPELEA